MFFLVLLLAISGTASDIFGDSDVKRVGDFVAAQIGADGSVQGSLAQTYLAVDTLARLKLKIPHSSSVCTFIKKAKGDVDSGFFAASIASHIDCQLTADFSSTVSSIFGDADDVSLTTLTHAVHVFTLQKLVLDEAEVEPASAAILALADSTYESGLWSEKADQQGTLLNTGLALSALSKLKLDDSTKSDARKHGENALSQEITDLKGSAFLLQGLMDIGVQVPDSYLFQTTHFLLSHKDVSSLEDVHALVVGLQAASRAQRKPVVVSVQTQVLRQAKAESVKVLVTDIWGKGIGKLASLTLLSARQVASSTALVTNQQFVKESDTVYGFDFFKVRPDPGTYVFTLDVVPEASDFLAVRSFTVNIRVVAKVDTTDGSISVSSQASKEGFVVSTAQFTKSKTLTETVKVGADQHLFINFKLKNSVNNRLVTAQQAFVKFTNLHTRESVYFVVSQVPGPAYQLHVDVAKDAALFNSLSGDYIAELIIGDSHIDGSFRFQIGTVSFTFPGQATPRDTVDPFGPLPLISHKFQPDPVHAPVAISSFYSIAALVPLGLFVILTLRNGNLKEASTTGFLFVGFIAANFALIGYFWLALKLYQAVVGLFVLAIPTAYFGKSFLSSLAASRQKLHRD